MTILDQPKWNSLPRSCLRTCRMLPTRRQSEIKTFPRRFPPTHPRGDSFREGKIGKKIVPKGKRRCASSLAKVATGALRINGLV